MTGGNDPGSRKTVLRPQPGGVARSPGTVVAPAAPVAAGTPSAAAMPGAAAPAASVPIQDFIAPGSNPLVTAAGPLLSLGATVGATVYQADVEGLRRNAEEAVRAFDAQAQAARVPSDDLIIARFVLCTFLDSAILQTPWGGQEVWSPRSLLRTFHNQAGGGEVFFDILKRLRQDPKRYLDLLELQYVCLALGFQGMYRGEPNGAAVLQSLQEDLYRVIRTQRSGPGTELAAHWKGVPKPQAKRRGLIPWWVVGVVALAVVLAILILLRTQLAQRAAPTRAALSLQALPPVETGPPTPTVSTGRLKQLLAPQEHAQQVQVEESGSRTVITLTVPDLFQSGSAQAAPGHADLFAAIGHALEAVPGRIVIVGHTDDQPVRSFRYADNFELSRARAVAIAQLLKPQLTDFSRVRWTGLGAMQPRYQPPATPENRARNRRVEIVHLAE